MGFAGIVQRLAPEHMVKFGKDLCWNSNLREIDHECCNQSPRRQDFCSVSSNTFHSFAISKNVGVQRDNAHASISLIEFITRPQANGYGLGRCPMLFELFQCCKPPLALSIAIYCWRKHCNLAAVRGNLDLLAAFNRAKQA